jgi:hypothetical protein
LLKSNKLFYEEIKINKGVSGPNCDLLDMERLPCSSNPCYGGAKCYNYMDDYYCECPVGRNGKNCNTSTEDAPDPCSANPCGSNGICFTASKYLFILLLFRKIVLVIYLFQKQMVIGVFATTEKTV